jgi:CIC family chloride channel protein
MQPAGQVLSAETTISDALEQTRGAGQKTWIVSNARGVAGLVTREGLENAASSGSLDSQISTILKPGEFPHVHADHPLDEALDRLGANRLDLLPVVSRANVHQLLGVVRLQDVLEAYGVGMKT